ncbi:MAG: PKD domain-containing protein, partial [Desulfobacteraceae bacterium]|nr:PKD domain-containing protein [Desulfobacteraceae bacterium]
MGMKTRNRGLRTHFVNPLHGLILLSLLALLAGCGSSSDTQSAVREAESFGISATITSPSSNVVIAPGDSLTFNATASGGSGTYTFNWDTPGATTPNTTGNPSSAVTYNNEGIYTVTLSAVDDRGNTARDAVNVTVSSSQLATLLAQITSPTQSVTIADGGSVSFAGQG